MWGSLRLAPINVLQEVHVKYMELVDWNTGHGILDWNTGLEYWTGMA